MYRWEFDRARSRCWLRSTAPRVVYDVQILIRTVMDGVGLVFVGLPALELFTTSKGVLRVSELLARKETVSSTNLS